MNAIAVKAGKREYAAKARERVLWAKFKNVLKRLHNWDLIDGDAFLESKDWPYLWKK
jgi:hypothetical protein